jgi:hypothetical protein
MPREDPVITATRPLRSKRDIASSHPAACTRGSIRAQLDRERIT